MEKPVVKLIGLDSNVFVLLGACTTALKRAGQREQADELIRKVMSAPSYDHALALMMEYCDVE
jgi:hypothetical protein